MFKTKARSQLDVLVSQLRSWEATVPERAREFHAVRRLRESEIRQALPWWKLLIADEVVERYRDQVSGLADVAEPLTDLIRQAGALETEVEQFAARAHDLEPELSAWLEGRCRDWLAVLSRLGATCKRDLDLAHDQETFNATMSDVRLYDEAVRKLVEAQRIRTTLGADVRTAELTARLPQLRSRLYTTTAVYDWLEEITGLLKPLKGVAERIQDPPRELRNVSSILTEVRGWSLQLGESGAEVVRLEEQHFQAIDWDAAKVQGLVAEAQKLRSRLFERVEQVHSEKLGEIDAEMEDLRRACGRQADLEERLVKLRQLPFSKPPLFQNWLGQAAQFQNSFKSIAQSHAGRLETSLHDSTKKLAEALSELEKRPLSNEVNKEVALLEHELRQLPNATDVEMILRRLRRVNAMARQIDALDRRAQEEFQEIERRQRELAFRTETLQNEILRVKDITIDMSDITSKIAALSQSATEAVLETRRQQAHALTIELETLEVQFVDRCRERLGNGLQAIQRAMEVLQRVDDSVVVELPAIPTGASPRDAVQAVIDAEHRLEDLLQKARGWDEKLEARRIQVQTEISALRLEDLAPGDRHESEQLAEDLDHGTGSETTSLLDRLKSIAQLIERCERFFDRLRAEENSALARLDEMKKRLRAHATDHLQRFCPELTDRVEALVNGIPKRPRQWLAVHRQLDLAVELFGRVEAQARRLAAEEVERAADTLRQRLRSTTSSSSRATTQSLLAELDMYAPDTLAPVALRLRLINAAQRRV